MENACVPRDVTKNTKSTKNTIVRPVDALFPQAAVYLLLFAYCAPIANSPAVVSCAVAYKLRGLYNSVFLIFSRRYLTESPLRDILIISILKIPAIKKGQAYYEQK
jgi:hypothetical protein